MRRIFVTLLVLSATLSFAATAFAAEAPPSYHESFDAYDSSAWTPWYAQSVSVTGPDLGVLSASGGRVTVAPTCSRGGATFGSKGHVVTALPAHVSFTVYAPGAGYRAPSVIFTPSYYDFSFQPWVAVMLGTTHHAYSPSGVTVEDGNGVHSHTYLTPQLLFPSDTPISGEITLTATSVEVDFNGQRYSHDADVASVIARNGGLNFAAYSWDDSGMGGIALDELTITYSVDSTLPPVLPQIHKGTAVFNPRTLNLQSRGNNFMATVDLGAVDASAVSTGTVFLKAGSTNVAATGFTVSDSDGDGVGELRAVFDRAQVCAALAGSAGSVQLKVAGDLEDGSTFSASGYLTVVQSTTSSARAVWTRWRALR